MRRVCIAVLVGALLGCLVLTACSNPAQDEDASDRMTPPVLSACRDLAAEDLSRPSNDAEPVPCSADHTAQTFAIGDLPTSSGAEYDDKRHGKFVYQTCQQAFREFLGADESLALRIQLSWAWFRPSERAWDRGARWYRCDVVGGPSDASELRDLPTQAQGLFSAAPPDAWLTCADGKTVAAGAKVPCTEKHTWRAVTTIKLGEPQDPYPGDRIVQVRSRDFCQESVGAWTGYPPEYDYGFTWFREDRWTAGNRRSVCWAKTDR